MILEAEKLFAFSPRIIIKIPAFLEGYGAMAALSKRQIPIMATTILTAEQALFSIEAGADYLAPYVSHIGENWLEILQTLKALAKETKILAASLKATHHLIECAKMGITAVTLKKELLELALATDPRVTTFLDQFSQAAERIKIF